MRSIPWLTLLVALAVLVIQSVPEAAQALALDRGITSEPWRWWTGHLAHFSWNHLAWDLMVWVVLGAWLETRSRLGLAGLWLVGSVVISAMFLAAQPELTSYRGLSGLDAALSAAVIVELWRTSSGGERWLPGTLAALLAGKVLVEVATGHTLFADDAGWVAVPLAHATGALAGGLIWSTALPSGTAAGRAAQDRVLAGTSTAVMPAGTDLAEVDLSRDWA